MDFSPPFSTFCEVPAPSSPFKVPWNLWDQKTIGDSSFQGGHSNHCSGLATGVTTWTKGGSPPQLFGCFGTFHIYIRSICGKCVSIHDFRPWNKWDRCQVPPSFRSIQWSNRSIDQPPSIVKGHLCQYSMFSAPERLTWPMFPSCWNCVRESFLRLCPWLRAHGPECW